MLFTRFTQNKYFSWYQAIISKAKERVHLKGENHHIVPRSLGGDNSKSNIVKLTYREHFICHLLLTKFTTGDDKRKMAFAVKYMLAGIKKGDRYLPASKLVEMARREFAKARSDSTHTQESKLKIAESMKGNCNKLGKKHSVETNAKIAAYARKSRETRVYKHNTYDIELAKNLLKSDLNRLEVANRCGFKHLSNFGTWFKKKTGLTPLLFQRT